jgi:minor curlin subunit
MTIRPFIFILRRLLLCFVFQGVITNQAFSQDLSIMSDYGMSDFYHDSAIIFQNGSFNQAAILQSNDLGSNAGSYAEINQEGSDSFALVTQLGEQNSARVNQIRDSNYANVTQDGFGNSADISQSDSYNTVYATQIGNNNSISLTQSSSATATLMEIGNNNTINATQNFGGKINIRIEGDNKTVTVHQN